MQSGNKNWVIHFSADDYWHSNPHSRHHITEQLNRDYSILWINPIGSRMPSFRKKTFKKRIFRKVKSIIKYFRKVKPGFYVVTFVIIPYFKKGRIQKFNGFLLKFQLNIIAKRLGIKQPLLFYTSPVFANTIDMIKSQFAVYYYSDQYTAYREFDDETRKYTEQLDKKLYENVDLVMCASQQIYDNVVDKTSKKVVYFPHQVDYNLFANNKTGDSLPDIDGIKKPIIGYYGTLTDSNDWQIIKYCAEQRPDYNFVFIGRKDIENTGLEEFNNVYFLGKKPFNQIPAYGRYFDVGIMFWIVREWIQNCSPLKLKEYLSLGIPVVSTFIEEVKNYFDNIVYVTRTKEEFLEALDKAIRGDNSERIANGLEIVKNDTWYNAVKIIKEEMSVA